jgi:hypothetical protein
VIAACFAEQARRNASEHPGGGGGAEDPSRANAAWQRQLLECVPSYDEVSGPLRHFCAAVLTGIYLRDVCSCHEIIPRRNGLAQLFSVTTAGGARSTALALPSRSTAGAPEGGAQASPPAAAAAVTHWLESPAVLRRCYFSLLMLGAPDVLPLYPWAWIEARILVSPAANAPPN